MYYELYLPFPPTVNNYYSSARAGGRFISRKGREFRERVHEAVAEQLPEVRLVDRLCVDVVLFAPDRRARDLDNYMKALLDAITHSGIWADDSQIDRLCISRGEVRSGSGSCYVRIEEAEAGLDEK